MSSLFSPKAPSANNTTISNSSLSSARGSSLLGGSTATRRMPAMATANIGNMSVNTNSGLNPLAPKAPTSPRLTQNPLEGSYEKEMKRRGLLSTLLGREPKDATAIFRRNSLSNIIGG